MRAEQLCDFGYRFGYRRQFGLFSSDYAKLRRGHGLVRSLITLIYHRLTVFSGNSKSVGSNSMGVRFPLPAPSIHIIFSGLRAPTLNFSHSSGTKSGTVRILVIFNRLKISPARSSAAG